MDLSKAGVWYMLLCWLSAIGGIAMAVLWAASGRRLRIDDRTRLKPPDSRPKGGEVSTPHRATDKVRPRRQ